MTRRIAAPTRRSVIAAGLALPFAGRALAAETSAAEQSLYEAAKKEGQLTWYTAHFSGEAAQHIGTAFTEKYPGINVNVIRTTAQVAYQRLTQEFKAGAPQVDVFSSTDMGHFTYLKEKGLLIKYRPENADKVIEAFRNVDPDDFYHTTSAGLITITYNKEKVKEAEAPKSWKDLTDPKWNEAVALGHPGFSGYVGTWVVMMEKLYGWDYFEKLAKNKPQIGRSINDTVTMLNSAERIVAAGPSATTLQSAAKGNPLGVIYPSDGTVLIIAPSGLPKGIKNINAAKLFMNFLLSRENSRVMVSDFGESLWADVPPPKGGKSIADLKTIRPTTAEIEKGIPRVKEKWRDTFGI
jgi:iron(III) transport system substrate-binding protein